MTDYKKLLTDDTGSFCSPGTKQKIEYIGIGTGAVVGGFGGAIVGGAIAPFSATAGAITGGVVGGGGLLAASVMNKDHSKLDAVGAALVGTFAGAAMGAIAAGLASPGAGAFVGATQGAPVGGGIANGVADKLCTMEKSGLLPSPSTPKEAVPVAPVIKR